MVLVARYEVFWIAIGIASPFWGFISTRFRTIREPLAAGFLLFTAGMAGLATLQPDDSLNAIVFAAVVGVGLASAIILIIAGVQLSTPHHLIATATALITSSRALAATLFTAIYTAAFRTRYAAKLPAYVGKRSARQGFRKAQSYPLSRHSLLENPHS